MLYILEVNDQTKSDVVELTSFNYLFVSVMSEKEADEFVIIQEKAKYEIKDKISELTKKGLISNLPTRDKTLLFLLVYLEGCLIAYGYSIEDPDDKDICYINTIFVSNEHRGLGLSSVILKKLINENLTRYPHFKKIKGITQNDNKKAQKILINMGFIHSQ